MSGWELMPFDVEQMSTLIGPSEYHWVWDGEYVALARWVPYRWHIGTGLAYDTCKITHYYAMISPLAPDRNNENGWVQSPPSFIPFHQSWCWDGEHIYLATWQVDDQKWVTKMGLRFDPDKITHYQLLESPKPPLIETKKSESNEVIYADL